MAGQMSRNCQERGIAQRERGGVFMSVRWCWCVVVERLSKKQKMHCVSLKDEKVALHKTCTRTNTHAH